MRRFFLASYRVWYNVLYISNTIDLRKGFELPVGQLLRFYALLSDMRGPTFIVEAHIMNVTLTSAHS
jgi:hypothetical protein